MKISSSVRPNRVEIKKYIGNKVELLLRDNIEEATEVDLLTQTELTKFTYDEVKVVVKNRDNLIEFIEKSFDNWFTKGKKIEKLENEIKSKKEEIDRLIDGFEQVEVNESLENSNLQALLGVATNYEDQLNIQDELMVTLMAVTDLYEIILGGM